MKEQSNWSIGQEQSSSSTMEQSKWNRKEGEQSSSSTMEQSNWNRKEGEQSSSSKKEGEQSSQSMEPQGVERPLERSSSGCKRFEQPRQR
jgi:hypothetical protein